MLEADKPLEKTKHQPNTMRTRGRPGKGVKLAAPPERGRHILSRGPSCHTLESAGSHSAQTRSTTIYWEPVLHRLTTPTDPPAGTPAAYMAPPTPTVARETTGHLSLV